MSLTRAALALGSSLTIRDFPQMLGVDWAVQSSIERVDRGALAIAQPTPNHGTGFSPGRDPR
jgi:hypothetical protein